MRLTLNPFETIMCKKGKVIDYLLLDDKILLTLVLQSSTFGCYFVEINENI